MLEETDAKLFAVPHGVFELCVGIGRGGAIQVGIDFGGLLLFLGVVAVSFGVGLGTQQTVGQRLARHGCCDPLHCDRERLRRWRLRR